MVSIATFVSHVFSAEPNIFGRKRTFPDSFHPYREKINSLSQ